MRLSVRLPAQPAQIDRTRHSHARALRAWDKVLASGSLRAGGDETPPIANVLLAVGFISLLIIFQSFLLLFLVFRLVLL